MQWAQTAQVINCCDIAKARSLTRKQTEKRKEQGTSEWWEKKA
jgi:hypothetical protein